MNTSLKTMLQAMFVTLLCFGVASASAQALTIENITGIPEALDPLNPSELVSEFNEVLVLQVEFSENLYDFTTAPGYDEDTSPKPELEFFIGTGRKTAQFRFIFDNLMFFEYTLNPGDYGTGLTVKEGDSPATRVAIVRNRTLVQNVGQAKTLANFSQYTPAVATAINGDAGNQAIKLNMFKIEDYPGTFHIDVGRIEDIVIRRPNSAFGNTTRIDLVGSSVNPLISAFTDTPALITDMATLKISGLSPGTNTMRVASSLHPAEYIDIPVVVGLSGDAKKISFDPEQLRVDENAQSPRQSVRVSLGSIATQDVTLNLAISGGANANRIGFPATVTILKGHRYRDFDILTPDGDANAVLVFTHPDYDTAMFDVVVDNLPPSIVLPVPTLDTFTQQLRAEKTVVVGEMLEMSAEAWDPAGTNDTINYRWVYKDSGGVEQTILGETFSGVFDRDSTVVLYAWDEDGGDAKPLYISVIVETGLLLTLTPAPDGFKGLEGVGSGTFRYINPGNVTWNADEGNRFGEKYQKNGVLVRAVPDAGSYHFTWIADEGISEASQVMPGSITNVTIALAETLDVMHVFSRAYYPGIDTFGDIDADGLSDAWEGKWFGSGTSADIPSLAVVDSKGAAGEDGNPDGDYLPLVGEVAIPNILDGGLIRVFEYPITDHGGDLWNWTGYLPNEKNPFVNIIEYRGLEEDRAENGSWVRYADALPKAGSATRGNAPATDPNLLDTDEDGMDDGWEYYFWTTIMYEVNPQNWRAFDPSFNYYNADDTSEAGLPLLRVGYPTQTVTTNLPNAYANDGLGSAFSGMVTNLPVQYGTFKITFDDGTEYVDAGKGRLERSVDVLHPYTGTLETIPINVLTINYVTGEWTIVPPPGATLGANYVITYEILDGLYSQEELRNAFDPASKGNPMRDTDGDGLYDWEEFALGTNPLHWDTDGDGMPDGWEVERGLDPLIGDRVFGNANGALGNPDGDKMAPGHALAYIQAMADQRFWNGATATGFDPTVGWREGDRSQPDFTNLEEFRVAEYYALTLDQFGFSPNVEIGPKNWLQWTTDPCDNDTDGNGAPDGWELYLGLRPVAHEGTPIWMEDPLDDAGKIEIVLGMVLSAKDFDLDGLPIAEEFSCVEAAAFRETDETVVINGVTARRRAFPHLFPEWTNKPWPTDPWNADTDGDGLIDGLEYMDPSIPPFDANGDENPLVNLNPTSVDTDGDGLPDAWEYFHGLQTTNNPSGDFFISEDVASPTGPYGDPDGDGLSNYQEYLTGVNYGWRYDKRYAPEDEKYWLPDWSLPGAGSLGTDPYDTSFRAYDAFDFLRPYPRPVALQRGFETLVAAEVDFGITPPGPADPTYDYTDLEILQRVITVIQNPLFFGLPDAAQSILLIFERDLRVTPFSYGLQPISWDPAFFAVKTSGAEIPYFFLKHQTHGRFATTHPRKIDSDYDGMDDYWEVFHGLNPLYGGDRAGGDSEEERMMGYTDVNMVLSLHNNSLLPLARAGQDRFKEFQSLSPWRPYGIDEPRGPAYYNLYWNTAIPYDLVNNPALSGCPWGDADKDGLNNREEAFNLYASDVMHHTDPSPYWMTDISYEGSHVNRYYSGGSMTWNWWWNVAFNNRIQLAPTYLWDFEVNEGFDTDNNNISDREELTGTDGMGMTDPLDFDSPRARKAMYLDGDAACRTRNPYFHDKWALTSYTVEMWFRAEEPVGPQTQTLIERPVAIPIDSSSAAWKIRRTFRLSLTENGRLKAEFDNDADSTFSTEATLENGKISPNVWYHVAVTMDSQANRFGLYLNGALLASVPCDLKPATGYFAGSQIADYDPPAESNTDVFLQDIFQFSPAPIVIGASDENPFGVIEASLPPGHPLDPTPKLSRFFKGWVDEVRIWDRVRTQSQIQQDLFKRYGKEEVAAVNDVRFAWDQDNAQIATALTEFPQKLLYHYGFDNLPDVIPGASRDPNAIIPDHDTHPLPDGYDSASVMLGRPDPVDYPGVPWWIGSRVRSRVYSTDYTYIPFIENTAAHLRQYPPFDIQSIRPVFDENYDLLGYRWRKSEDWLESLRGSLNTWNPINPGAEFDVHPDLIPNAANPYGFRYTAGISMNYEINPMSFGGHVGLLSQYEKLPIYTDMLPLLNAVADIDVEMWDGLGAGSNFAALDSDGDGLPDWWEIANGLDPYDPTGLNGAYGDPDGDGLDNMGEYLAGTNPWSNDTNGDGYSDYDSRDDNWSLTYGELYDDGDGMPNDWEIQHGLNPNRYDAAEDLDNDGWTNYEEYLAGTLPDSAYSYPSPSTEFTFYYDGVEEEIPSMVVYTYSESTYGTAMGGRFDARLSTHRNIAGDSGYLGTDGTMSFQGQQIPVSYLAYGKIHPQGATLTVRVPNEDGTFTEQTLPLQPFNEEMGVFNGGGMGRGAYLFYASGAIWPWEGFAGLRYSMNYSHGWEFPVKVRNPIVSSGSHIRGGYNRFFGFLDLNSDGEYTSGEPCGLSVTRPVLVSYDSFSAVIACTDKLVGYPRISWEALPESQSTDPYRIDFQSGGNFIGTFYVKKPRTYFHEGDMLAQGMMGLDFGAATSGAFTYSVADGSTSVATGNLQFDLGTTATRRPMKARYPIQLEKVYGNLVEFEWEMDYRSSGATILIKGLDNGITYYNNTIPLPLRHGKVTDEVYYYTATPQTLDGKRYVELPAGRYTYTITEYIRSTGITKKSVTERFQVVKEESDARDIYSISGNLSYFGKAEIAENVQVLHTFDGTQKGHSGTVVGTSPISPGTISLQVVDPSGHVVESLSDSRADGALLSESGTALSGRIYYDLTEYAGPGPHTYVNSYYVEFLDPVTAGYRLRIAYKYFLKPIVVEAFKLNDDAISCYAVAGTPVARVKQYRKGAYTLRGLTKGKYAVRAYIDSNQNTMLDSWESSGVAVNGSSQGPVVYTTYLPIEVPQSQVGKDIVLRDKDTDNDLLPDAWEFQHFGSISAKSGYDQNQPGVYIWMEYADGPLDSNPNMIDTDGDGLSDGVELLLTGTDTHLTDTDFDGISDLEEFLSGSNPLDPNDAKSFKTLGVAFDAEGNPYVICPHPELIQGIVVSYILKYKANLTDKTWKTVCDFDVHAPDISAGRLPAGEAIMKPKAEDVDWQNGFFKVDVQVDYGTWEGFELFDPKPSE